ncbi:uncharacterized protein LOC120162167 [Hibiscus syriacus]|uniref:uncharacterized protein LOC120162167 n=1 Tax=Hibiscus syriacus TaxID=106335 RepID=UPI001920751C|nr:uncharacterized protein LOC120162167 [Hibiscus syriacus]
MNSYNFDVGHGDDTDIFKEPLLLQLSYGILTLICFFTKYGLRQILFLDALQEYSMFVRVDGYRREPDKAFCYLACILVPSFFVEIIHKVIFFSTLHSEDIMTGLFQDVTMEIYIRIRKQLSITSHRYRFFIIASLVVVTASQFFSFVYGFGFHIRQISSILAIYW